MRRGWAILLMMALVSVGFVPFAAFCSCGQSHSKHGCCPPAAGMQASCCHCGVDSRTVPSAARKDIPAEAPMRGETAHLDGDGWRQVPGVVQQRMDWHAPPLVLRI
ncbi:MAG TPA: hypothetical protein VGG56_09600 [Terracidiphilus sp.]